MPLDLSLCLWIRSSGAFLVQSTWKFSDSKMAWESFNERVREKEPCKFLTGRKQEPRSNMDLNLEDWPSLTELEGKWALIGKWSSMIGSVSIGLRKELTESSNRFPATFASNQTLGCKPNYFPLFSVSVRKAAPEFRAIIQTFPTDVFLPRIWYFIYFT